MCHDLCRQLDPAGQTLLAASAADLSRRQDEMWPCPTDQLLTRPRRDSELWSRDIDRQWTGSTHKLSVSDKH